LWSGASVFVSSLSPLRCLWNRLDRLEPASARTV